MFLLKILKLLAFPYKVWKLICLVNAQFSNECTFVTNKPLLQTQIMMLTDARYAFTYEYSLILDTCKITCVRINLHSVTPSIM